MILSPSTLYDVIYKIVLLDYLIFTGKKDKKYSVFQELKTIMKTSGRRLRSGKTLTNKTLNSINKSVKESGTKTENKKAPTRILKSTSTKSRSRKTEKIKEEEKKENVPRINKLNISGNRSTRRTGLSSKKKVTIPEGTKLKNKTSFRQMSLKESFSNQEALVRRLRPRKESRNYCEDSALQQSNENSMKASNENGNSKVPVYKSIKSNEESLRNGSDIYDFKYDANDTKERLAAKRKRRVINRMRQKRIKKAEHPKVKQVRPTTKTKVSNDALPENIVKITTDNKQCIPNSSSDNDKKPALLPSTTASSKSENDAKQKCMLPPSISVNTAEVNLNNVSLLADSGMESDDIQPLETNCSPLTKVISNNTDKQPNIKLKPMIISVEKIDINKVLTDTPVKSNTENFIPFRKTNIFNNKALLQYGNMMNHSLINKSFSPIKKAFENFDPGSPWRLSSLNTFSQVKNLFQSTPQPRPLEILQGKIKQNMKDQVQVMETAKKRDALATVDKNAGTQKTSSKSHMLRKFGQSFRKFGTEITNLEHSVQSANNTAITEQHEETSNKELRFPDINLQNTMDTMGNNSPAYNDTAKDKENAAPKRLKSKKSLKKRLRNVGSTSFSLQKDKGVQDKENLNVQSVPVNVETFGSNSFHSEKVNEEQGKENFDPQPGPSGLQKYKSPNNKPLQQTNLNAFLNITEMPESIRISTVHGIFNDAHSTPINGKPVKSIKKIDTKNMELDNAFGFEESSGDSNLDISPIYPNSEENALQNKHVLKTNVAGTKRNSALPVRLVPPEIKKTILQKYIDSGKKVTKNVEKENEKEKEKEKEKESENVKVQKPLTSEKVKPLDTISFSDTFDVLTEDDKKKEESLVVPLFTDLEPVHFTEPPKRLYRRKRNVRFTFTESSSENDEELEDGEPERKKKKYGKLKKEDEKRMKEWVKSINETFQEIDHFELLVE